MEGNGRVSLVAQYALPPEEIEPLSHRRALDSVRLAGNLSVDQSEVVMRIVYAAGDPDLAPFVHVHPDAVAAGASALRLGRPIVTDVKMVRAGIDRRLASRLGCRMLCAIDDAEVITRSDVSRLPRAVEAMRLLARDMEGAVVVIGNAPTALLALLDLVDEEIVQPAVIVGIPVGFVAAAESKAELVRRRIPWVTVEGTRGGSAMAVSAVNTMLRRAAAMPAGDERTAILFLGHGSSRSDAGAAMERVLESVRRRARFEIVEHGYLALAEPTIAEGVRRCIQRGATRIVAAPYFLHCGLHMLRDLPAVLRAEQERYPTVEIVLGRHIGHHPDLVEIMLDRIGDSWRLPSVDKVDFTADYYDGLALPRRGPENDTPDLTGAFSHVHGANAGSPHTHAPAGRPTQTEEPRGHDV